MGPKIVNRKDFLRGLLSVAAGASVVSAIAAQYGAETIENTAPADVPTLSEAEIQKIGQEMLQARIAHSAYTTMQHDPEYQYIRYRLNFEECATAEDHYTSTVYYHGEQSVPRAV